MHKQNNKLHYYLKVVYLNLFYDNDLNLQRRQLLVEGGWKVDKNARLDTEKIFRIFNYAKVTLHTAPSHK